MKSVTFAVIACNSEKTIIKCLEAIKSIQYPKEIILIDDSSQDRTLAIAGDYAARIIVKKKEDKGISISRNIAIEESKGEYLFIIDSDIEIIQADVESILSFIENNNLIAISGSYTSENSSNKQDYGFLLDIRREKIFFKSKRSYLYSQRNYTTFSGGFCCISKDKIFNLNNFKSSLRSSAEDLIWQVQLIKQGLKFGYYSGFIGIHHHERKLTEIFSKCLSEARGGIWLLSETLKERGFTPVLEQVSYIPTLLIIAFLFLSINPVVTFFLILFEFVPYIFIQDKRLNIKTHFIFITYFLLCKLGFLYYLLKSLITSKVNWKVKTKLIVFSLYSDLLAKFKWVIRNFTL